jgi:peroxiredoxin
MAVSEAVPLSPLNVCPLLTGMAIPQVILRTVDNEAFDLNSAVRQQASVLVFYRGGW